MRKLLVVVLLVVVDLSAYLALRPTEAEQYERLRHAQAIHVIAKVRCGLGGRGPAGARWQSDSPVAG